MTEKALVFNGVTKAYGTVTACQDLSFEVRPGELFGFVGSNGAGKTTAMRIALGVLAADSGTVALGDTPLTFEDRRRIGYMPEERGLYPKMTVTDQLVHLARLHGRSKSAALAASAAWTERVGLADRGKTEIGTLSLGNQQRVQLAAALVHEPDVLVLDEPFSGLDPLAVDVMSDVLRERAAAGVPVLFSSHQLELVERLCHRIGIIRDGRMIASGTADELRAGAAAGPERVLVEVPGAEPDWARRLPGTEVESTDGDRVVVGLVGADPQALLHAAMAAGPVREFRPLRPSLAELFRSAVTTSPDTTPEELVR